MASAFNLTAQLNLKGPTNVAAIVGNINKQLTAINANVNIKINPSAQNTVTQLNSSFQTFNRTLSQTTTNTNAVAAALNSLRTSIGQVNNPLNNLLQNLQNNANAANQFNQNLRNTQQACNRAATTIEEMGRQAGANVRRFAAFATVTGSIYKFGNALNAAAKEFVEFNKELVRVAQVTDTNISGLKGLVAEITALSTGFGIASNDLIKVSSTLAQAGLSARDTEKALKALALSALAPSFDSLNDTVEGSIALMRQFGISADDLEGALGSVNAVAAKFAVEASDIITAIQRTGGVFATASRGVSQGKDALNEFIAVFTSIRATTRESAETISTGLRTIFTRIQRKDTIDALKEYGVVLTDLTGKFVGPFEATKRLSEGLSKLDPRDIRFSQIVEELGGFRQIGKVIPLIQQFATAQQALKVAQQGQASLAADAAVAQESVANRITKVREEFIALIRSIGESSSFQTFVKLTLDLASALIRLADAAKNVLPAITAIAAVRGAGAVAQFGRGFIGGLTGNRRNAGGPITRFASGGFVPGQGNSDTVPAMLTPGEFVIRKKAVQALGVDRLASMNRYAGGGRIIKGANEGLKSTSTRESRFGERKFKPGKSTLQFDVNPGEIGAFVLSPPKGTEGGYSATQPYTFSLPSSNKYAIFAAKQAGLSPEDIKGGINAVINPATYPIFYPGLTEGRSNLEKNAKYSSAIRQGFLDAISAGVKSTINNVKSQKLLDIPPALDTDENLINGITGKIQQDNQVRSTIEGYLFESMISAFTGASAAGGTSNFDFPRSAISQNRSKLAALFGSASEINKLVKAEAKRSYGEVGGNIQRKLSNDIIAGKKGGVTIKTGGTRQRFAKGGSASDTVPALLTPGEFVINKKAAQRIGLSTLHKMNHADKVQGYASGGVVQKFVQGGTALAQVQKSDPKTAAALTAALGGQGYTKSKLGPIPNKSLNATQVQDDFRTFISKLDSLNMPIDQATAAIKAWTRATAQGADATQAFDRAMDSASKSALGATSTGGGTKSGGGFLSGVFGKAKGLNAKWESGEGIIGKGMKRMGGMGGMILTMGGGMAIEGLSRAMGGETTETGRNISAVGGNALTYASVGSSLGSMFGPLGTIIGGLGGAAAGAAIGLVEAENAGKEFAIATATKAKDLASEKSGKAIETYGSATKPTAAMRSAALTMLGETSAKEEELSKSIREKSKGSALTRFLTLGFAGKEADTATVVEEQLKAQSAGAEQATKFISIEMQKSGKTFAELSKNMNPAELAKLQKDIAQADRAYVYEQEQNAKEVARLRSEGKNAEADQVAAQGVERQKQLAEVITKRQMAENDAAIQAQTNAKEAQRLAIALRKATMTIESTFDAVGQALSSSSFEMNQLDNRTAQIVSGVSKPENMFEKNINVLKNPMAYSQQERQAAENAVSPLLGNQAGLVTGVAKLGGLKNKAIEAGLAKEMTPGASQDEVISAVAGSLRSQIGNTFGPNSDAARTFNDQITKLADQLQEAGGNLSAAEIADQLSGGLDEASKKAAAIQEQANQLLAESFNKLSNIGNQLSAVQQKQIERGRELADMQAANTFALKDALGIRVSSQERITQRNQQAASRLGFQDPNQVTTASVIGRYGQLQAGRSAAEANVSAMSAAGAAGVNNQLIQASKTLSDFDSEIKNIEQEISNLPKTLQSNLDDIFGEMKQRVSQLEGAKQAGGNFAERLVTSTPQELMELNNTFNLMNSTLNGNVTTIQQSQSAQKAYYTALMNGKSAQEAMTDAQQAFATENKNALALFKDLSEVAGVQGPEFDRMKADLLEGFAKAQGLQNFKPLQMMIAKLRETPEQRAANDPILMALRNQADTIARAQADAVALANEIDRQKQAELLTNVGNEIIRKLQATPIRVEVAVGNMMAANANLPAPVVQQQRRSKGGLIYASKGMYVNYQAKGTDTVPAMLTPGEFVVNASATRKNLPLLKSINRANGGLMPQAGLNKAFGNMPADQTMSNMFFSPQATNMYANMNPMREAIMRNIPLPQVLQERKKRAQERITGPYLQRKKQAESRKAYIAEMRRRKEQLIDPYIKKPKYKAAGGTIVPYEPKGTDTVPAMLSPGEFVVNRAATQRNLPLLKTINRAKGGPVQYLQHGTQPPMGNGVSNGMDQLGARFDRFIEQIKQVLPPVIKVEGVHQVNVVINGASVLADLLNGPIGNYVTKSIQSAFDQKSSANEGN